jgi:NadR type nicotinamide-nucleotide adenylyltransferase
VLTAIGKIIRLEYRLVHRRVDTDIPVGVDANRRPGRKSLATLAGSGHMVVVMPDLHYPTGLIVGRFCPPHLGHSHLIRAAQARCDELVVFVNTRATEPIPGILRAQWLADLHPDVDVVQVVHDLDTNFADPDLWDAWIDLFGVHWPLDDGPHAVFSSEPYGDELARRLDADAVVVDEARLAVPISATQIRDNPLAHLDKLAEPVRSWVERWGRAR